MEYNNGDIGNKEEFIKVLEVSKKLADKYPFVIDKDGINVLESMPIGWLDSFMDLMLEELDTVIKKDGLKYRVEDAGNNYGELKWDDIGGNIETDMIIHKYSVICSHICIKCGKADVGRAGSVFEFPYCLRCFGAEKSVGSSEYEAFKKIDKESKKIPTSIKYYRMQIGKINEYSVDINDTVKKIRSKKLGYRARDFIK